MSGHLLAEEQPRGRGSATSSDVEYTPDWRRWVALGQLSLLNGSNCFQYVLFATIVDQARDYFGITNAEINWLPVVYNMLFFVLGAFTQQIYRVFGLKRGLAGQSFLNCAGAGLKVACAVFQLSFGWVLVSQFLAAFGQVPGAPPALAMAWFPEKERTLATALSAAANNVGNAIGLLVPPLIVTSASKVQFSILCSILFAITLVDFILAAFVVPKGPRTPPSAACEEIEAVDEEAHQHKGVLAFIIATYASCFRVAKNPRFITLLFGFSLVNGVFWALSTFSAQVMQPFGVTETQVGGMGFTSIALGSVASLVVSAWIDRSRVYWWPNMAFFGLTAVSCAMMNWTLYSTRTPAVWVLWLLWAFIGTVQSCVIPVGFEFAAEITFPEEPATSGAVLMILSNGVAAIIVPALNPVIGNNPDQTTALRVMTIMGALWGVAALLAFFTPNDLRRLRFERGELGPHHFHHHHEGDADAAGQLNPARDDTA